MKLIRHGLPGREAIGFVTDSGEAVDASGFGEDLDGAFLASEGPARLAEWAKEKSLPTLKKGVRLAEPLANCSKIICVGLNYRKHAIESGMDIPKEPILFYKSTTAISGPFDPVVIPLGSEKTDWEVELAVVIGKRSSYVSEEEAMDHVAGYLVHNDISERAFQLERGGQWLKGKSCDTFAPLGPWLVTKDEINDPHDLGLWLTVNGEKVQSSSTSDLIFKIPFLISYITSFMTLLPGDVISTGTPSGVGLGFDPPRFLKPGDVMELGIDGLGASKQTAVAYKKDL